LHIFDKEIFKKELQKQGITLTPKQEQQFKDYVAMLQEWNQKMNLTAITEENAIYEKHFYDSILPFVGMEEPIHLCDVGAGAGFPSIPLKIVFPKWKVTIVEPLHKRIRFLKALGEALSIDVTLEHMRGEDFAKQHREQFDLVTARAVANLPILSELCIPLVKVNGIFLAMKGASGDDEAQHATNAIQCLGCRLSKRMETELSDGSKRVNLIYEKVKKTPQQYPRAFSQIKKHPL